MLKSMNLNQARFDGMSTAACPRVGKSVRKRTVPGMELDWILQLVGYDHDELRTLAKFRMNVDGATDFLNGLPNDV